MRIELSQVVLTSSRVASISDVARTSTQAWIGDRPASPTAVHTTTAGVSAAQAQVQAQAQARAAIARLSAQALTAARQAAATTTLRAGTTSGPGAAPDTIDPNDPTITDPNLRALIMLIERFTGHKVHLIRLAAGGGDTGTAEQPGNQAATAASQAPAPPPKAGWGVEVQVEQVHQETETTDFSAAGKVVTADGRTISFDYGLAMHRDFTQTATADIQLGDAVKKVDPIALNLTGGPIALSADRSGFDINSDGTAEQVAMPAAGTYFLAMDRNGNGTIDNGKELFGPTSGNGFAELKALDSDGNGWIDEGDAAFASLKLWDGSGGPQQSLAQAGVGALYVGAGAATQFDLRNEANETMGQVVSSSVYLGDNGKPGALAQVDLTA